ncbi:hypothetical protein [Priestia koreensis]|nr:hypothetical protein [Priestia koreensis]
MSENKEHFVLLSNVLTNSITLSISIVHRNAEFQTNISLHYS